MNAAATRLQLLQNITLATLHDKLGMVLYALL